MATIGNREKNIRYLRKVFLIKRIFLPLLILLDRIGLVKPFEKLINYIINLAGIKKSVNFFFKYKDFCKLFRDEFKSKRGDKGTILFPVMTGVNGNFTLLYLLFSKYFFEKEGLQPVFLVCDSAVNICSKDGMLKSRKTHPFFCHECWFGYKNIAKDTGIEIVYFTQLVNPADSRIKELEREVDKLNTLKECNEFTFGDIQIGAYARKSVLRYFLIGKFSDWPKEIEIYRDFLKAIGYYSIMFSTYLEKTPDLRFVVIYNGTLGFESVARQLASEVGIPYITQETFLGQNGLIYKKNDEVMKLDWSFEYEEFKRDFKFDGEATDRADSFFSDLKSGKLVYKKLNEEQEFNSLQGVSKYVCLFTNMNFDTAVLDRNTIFENMEEWLYSIIDFWIDKVKDISLVIRIHPGESKIVTASKEFMGDRIRDRIKGVANIYIIDSNEKFNSYHLISGMNYGLIYSSTIGLEIAYLEKCCIVAGMPYFRNKSFVITPASQQEYFETIMKMNSGKIDFIPDRDELIRTVNFVYFNRLKKLNGIKIYTPEEVPNTIYTTPEAMINDNLSFFEGFRNELIENN